VPGGNGSTFLRSGLIKLYEYRGLEIARSTVHTRERVFVVFIGSGRLFGNETGRLRPNGCHGQKNQSARKNSPARADIFVQASNLKNWPGVETISVMKSCEESLKLFSLPQGRC
jgi:hypothetical protein